MFYRDDNGQDTDNDEQYVPCYMLSQPKMFRGRMGGGVVLRMYLGARKNLFQSNFWYSVSSGGPCDFFFFGAPSIMPDISMSLSRLRNHIAEGYNVLAGSRGGVALLGGQVGA